MSDASAISVNTALAANLRISQTLAKPLGIIIYIFFFGIFCYVGVEQGINNWVSQFLYQYHGLDPNVVGTEVISAFWGNLTLGTLVTLLKTRITQH